MEVDERTRQGFAELVREAYAVSADVGQEVERALQDGRDHPMDDREVAQLLTKVVGALEVGAERRGDEVTARALQGRVDEVVERLVRARGQMTGDGGEGDVAAGHTALELLSHNGIDPRPVFPRPIFLGREVAMNSGFVRVTDVKLWGENERLAIHLKQFQSREGRRPSPDELLDIMMSKTKLPGASGDDQFKIKALATSIAANGVREPPILDIDGTLLDGNRRVTACHYVLESEEFGSEEKKRAERVFVWQLTEHRTEEEREAVVVSSNFEPDLKEPWPVYVRARKVHEAWQEMLARETRAPSRKQQAQMKRELSLKFALGPDSSTVNRYLKMVEWADDFEDYHTHERKRGTYEVQHQAEKSFEYFDELGKGTRPGGVAYSLENDETFKHAVYDLLFRGSFKNWREIRELKHVHDNPEARESLVKAPKEADPDIAREKLEDALANARMARPEKRTVGANTRIETFATWLQELPIKAFRDDIKPRNLLRLRDALRLAENQVEAVVGRGEEEQQ